MHAKVTAVSPAFGQHSIAVTVSDRGGEVLAVVLNLENSARALPIGMPVTVRFDPCPSRS